MTQSVQTIGRVRVAVEANGAFATELAYPGNFGDLPVIEGSGKLTMERPYETPKLLQQHIDGYPAKVPMPRRGRFDFSMNLRGTAARGTAALLAADTAAGGGALFGTAFGAANYGTGTTIATSNSTLTVLNITSGAGMVEGGAIAIATGAGGALECREIKTVTGSVITLKLELSSIPLVGMPVYAAATYSLGNLDGSTVVYLQSLIEGYDALDRWLLKGGQLAAPPKFNIQPGTIPTVDWSFMFADHAQADGVETVMNPSGTALGDQNYPNTAINAVMDSELRVAPHAASTLPNTLVHAAEINIVPNIAYEPHTTPAGVNNIKQWVRSRPNGPAVTGDFLLPYETNIWRQARNDETPMGLYYQIGSSVVGGGFMISVPHIVIDNFQRETVGGLAGQRVSFYARLDQTTSGNLSALAKSVLRLHMF